MITGVNATLLESSAAGGVAEGGLTGGTTLDQQEFLTLFIAQLQNQDPLSPLQPEELTAQLAQFSSLEQLTGINSRLDTLTETSQQSTTGAVLSLIGRDVRFDGSTVSLRDGEAPEVHYQLPEDARAVTATVYAENGSIVRAVDLGPQSAGEHGFRFDGHDADGNVVADGAYRLEIAAAAEEGGQPTSLALVTTARVDGVDMSGERPLLLIGSERVALDRVSGVLAADRTTE